MTLQDDLKFVILLAPGLPEDRDGPVPEGDRATLVDRLFRDRPDLFGRFRRGRISLRAAATEAGIPVRAEVQWETVEAELLRLGWEPVRIAPLEQAFRDARL